MDGPLPRERRISALEKAAEAVLYVLRRLSYLRVKSIGRRELQSPPHPTPPPVPTGEGANIVGELCYE